jgi:hypothetical protein
MFDRRSWCQNPTEAAFRALDLTSGAAILYPLTDFQALFVTGATQRYLWVARDLAPWERAEVEAGRVSLSRLAQGRRKAVQLAAAS